MNVQDPAQFKQQLFDNFKRTGVLDKLKLQIREQLINQLTYKSNDQSQAKNNKSGQKRSENQDQEQEQEDNQNKYERQRLLSLAIAEHLKTHDLNYSYSIFLPELKISSENLIQQKDILDQLDIKEYQYQDLLAELPQFTKVSVLEIVFHVIRQKASLYKQDKEVQVDFDEQKPSKKTEESSEMKSSQFAEFGTTSSAKTFQLQLLQYKKEAEKRYQSQLEVDMLKFKEVELAEVRSGEAELFAQKLRRHKQDLEFQYEKKFQRLKEREQKALELCKKMQQDAERQIFEARQSQIEKIDQLTQAESSFRKHNCLESSAVKDEKEKITKLENELKIKIREYDEARKTIQTHVEHDVEIRSMIYKKEMEADQQALMKHITLSKKDEEVQKQYRDNLQFLENQRQYLSRNNENLLRDNKDLEYTKEQQSSEIGELRQRVQTLQEANDMYEQRVQRLESQVREQQFREQQLQESNKQFQTNLEFKNNEQVQIHKTFAEDIQTQYNKAIDSEKYFLKKLEEQKEQSKFEVTQLTEKNRLNEMEIQKLEDDNNELRSQLRSYKQNIEDIEYKQNLQEKKTQEQEINQKLSLVSIEKEKYQNQNFEDRIKNLMQQQKSTDQEFYYQVDKKKI